MHSDAPPLSISLAAFDGYPLAVALEECAKLGVHSVEPAYIKGYSAFDESEFTEARGREIGAMLQAAGLSSLAISAHVDSGAPDAVPALEQRLVFAAALGAKIVVTNAGAKVAREQFDRNIAALIPRCEQSGVALALENPGHGSGNLFVDAESGMEIVRQFASPCVRLNYDVGNIFTASNEAILPAADIAAALAGAAHLHLKDIRSTPEGWSFCAIGQGAVDYLSVRSIVRRLAPDMPVGIELPLRLSRPGRGNPVRAAEPVGLPIIRSIIRDSIGFWTADDEMMA